METIPGTLLSLIPFNSGGKWGFCDAERAIVIPCEYDWVQFFQTVDDENGVQQRAIVRKGIVPQDWRYGMIDETGRMCIPLDYADLEPFSCGLARVRLPKKTLYGFIDTLGQPRTHNEFETAKSFSEGLGYVTKPMHKRVQKHGFLDTDGVIRLEGTYLFDDAAPFVDRFAVVTHYMARGSYYSYLKPDGQFLTRPSGEPLDYMWVAHNFVNDQAIVRHEFHGYQIINSFGETVVDIQDKYDRIENFQNGLAKVRTDAVSGFIDAAGNEIIPCMIDYFSFGNFYDGLAQFREREHSKIGFVDTTLNIVIPCGFESAGCFSESLVWVEREGLFGFLNTRGEEVIPFRYTWADSFEEGFALVRNDERKFYIDRDGVEYCS